MPTATCSKVRYRDRLGAEIALANCLRKQRKRKKSVDEVRVYLCPRCNGWHLTSEAPRDLPD